MKPKYQIVYVQWRDATSVDSWESVASALNDEPHMVHTIGWLIREHKKHVVVALSIDPQSDSVSQYIIIPREWVMKILRHTA